MEINAVRGMKDILPEEARRRERVERLAKDVLECHGFGEIRTPLLERTQLFARSIGEATDIVSKEMYTFQSRGGDSLTLRPEATAGVVRAVVEHKLYAAGGVRKLYTIGPMFRYERPQKGRYRQFWQVNAEILGSDAPETDAEVICALMQIIEAAGVTGHRLEINSLGCPECREAFRAALQGFLQGRLEAFCPDCRQRAQTNPLRVFDCKIEGCKAVLAGAPLILDHICNECRAHFQAVQEYLRLGGVEFTLNPRIVRGLDYYRRTTFEVLSESLGAQSAFAGGGRYDGLVAQLGGPDLPAIGFAIGLDRLILLLPEEPEKDRPVFLAVLGEAARRQGFQLAEGLRRRGIRLEADLTGRGLKAQLKQADRARARIVVIVGDDELAQGKLTIRDMDTKEQESAAIEIGRLAEALARRLGR
ncbi:MAG: histidine--tRNA ligase [Pseudomonadota bacterium]